MVNSLLKGLMAIAVVGALGSIAALALAFAGIDRLVFWHAGLVIACGIVSMMSVFVLQLSVRNRVSGRESQRLFWSGCPRQIRWPGLGLALLGFAIWIWLGVRGYEPPEDEISAFMVGAFGLFVFPGVFVLLCSYFRKRPALNRQCSNGHDVPLDAQFCPTCGESLSPREI